jgi:hypothetical protein
MESLQPRIEALLAAPAGRAFLLIAARSGLDPAIIAEPQTSVEIAALALDAVSLWRVDRAAVLAELEGADSRSLENLARAVLTCTGAGWWFAPLQRSNQVWLSKDARPPLARHFVSPGTVPSSWERYAQKAAGGFFTSTVVDGASSAWAVIALGASDFADAFTSDPIACWRVAARPDARVLEIDGPQAWHSLCVKYAAHGEDGRTVPDWSAAARDFDAVHLTLGGLLTAEQVRIDSSAGWSEHWGWDVEQTLWLHWSFTEIERLPDRPLRQQPSPGSRAGRLRGL